VIFVILVRTNDHSSLKCGLYQLTVGALLGLWWYNKWFFNRIFFCDLYTCIFRWLDHHLRTPISGDSYKIFVSFVYNGPLMWCCINIIYIYLDHHFLKDVIMLPWLFWKYCMIVMLHEGRFIVKFSIYHICPFDKYFFGFKFHLSNVKVDAIKPVFVWIFLCRCS